MKNLLRKWIYSSAAKPGFYRRIWHPLSRLTALAQREHFRGNIRHSTDLHALLRRLSPDLKVLHGPFQGMTYPAAEAAGSSLFPKLLGSYEQELAPFMERAATQDYAGIVDIGCAEGYYAVGLGMRCPKARVWAYDTDDRAAGLCKSMAAANGVADRVNLGRFCDAAALTNLAGNGRLLVVSDCEGFERKLFTDAVCHVLSQSDLVIEIHDFIDPTISSHLLPIVSRTHQVQRLRSVSDAVRPQVYPYAELDGLEDGARIEVMAELRPLPMEWFVCTPRVNA